MQLLIILLPLFSTSMIGLYGAFLSREGSALLATIGVVFSFILSFLNFFYYTLAGDIVTIECAFWMDSGLLNFSWRFLFDTVTSVMLLVVTGVSSLVHIYSIGYMDKDPHLPRFMAYLSLFTFFMLILVTGDNFLQLFLGWEGVGLCSYLLISFWYTRLAANKAALKAMVINRVGDAALLIGVGLLFFSTGSVEYATIFLLAPYLETSLLVVLNQEYYLLSVIGVLLLIGVVGKSAQIGLHTWLPDAMEGPTPVSALIHAATMVTAGVFLLIRCSPIFEYTGTLLLFISLIGAITAIMASTIGFVQHDIKKIIAYSTCSQLGYMVLACGFSNYILGFFHLLTHACFKALLFLGAGSVIHAVSDEQDLRRMGGFVKLLPFTYSVLVVGSLALMGFPFLAGYYSKDMILEITFGSFVIIGYFFYWILGIATFMTALYSVRLLYRVFLDRPNGFISDYKNIHEAGFWIACPLALLAWGSIFLGYVFHEIFSGVGTMFFGQSIFVLPGHLTLLDVEFLPWYIKLLPLLLSVGGGILVALVYLNLSSRLYEYKFYYNKIYTFFLEKWYFDALQNKLIAKPFLNVGLWFTFVAIDKGFLELCGPSGLTRGVVVLGSQILTWHTGSILHYFRWMLLGVPVLLFVTVM